MTSATWTLLVGCLVVPAISPVYTDTNAAAGVRQQSQVPSATVPAIPQAPAPVTRLRTGRDLAVPRTQNPTVPLGVRQAAASALLGRSTMPLPPTYPSAMSAVAAPTAAPGLPGYNPAAAYLPGGATTAAPAVPSYGPVGRAPMGAAYMPSVPTAPIGGPMMPQVVGPYGPYATAPTAAPRTAATIGLPPQLGPTAVANKPFTDYTPPPVMSPYINLYRSNSLGTIDNYYTRVRPMLEQQQINQRTQFELRTLESTSRVQGSGLHQLDQRTQTLEGNSAPRYYMNFQQYYPGFQR